MRSILIVVLLTSSLFFSGCSNKQESSTSKSASSSSTSQVSADLHITDHNYLTAEDGGYTYAAALTEDQRKSGQGAEDVVFVRYLGERDGKYTFLSQDRVSGFYCENPCQVIKNTFNDQVVDRVAYNPATIGGAAIEDAINGYLVPYSPSSFNGAVRATIPTMEATPRVAVEDINALMQKANDLDEECRGYNHSPDDQVCKDWDMVSQQLRARGWCYGQDGRTATWAPCRS